MKKDDYVYRPVASYALLKQVEEAIEKTQTVDEVRAVMKNFGVKVGYKAFCYLFMQKMTPEAMKPDEAAAAALQLEEQGDFDLAQLIFARILEKFPNHPVASRHHTDKPGEDFEELPEWVNSLSLFR